MLFSGSKGIAYQEQLEVAVKSIFLGENILVNARETVLNPSSQHFFELDILIPNLNLGFEFQDLYHFSTTWYYQNPIDVVKARDITKTEGATQHGLTLVSVPCWWDTSTESLSASVQFQRPDVYLQTELSLPIPLNPPEEYFSGYFIPDIGEVMLASFSSSLSQFSDSISSQNSWWMGEKYDGIRCVWNARIKRLYTRRGLIVSLPNSCRIHLWVVENFLDGEIWCGRGQYLDAHRMVKFGSDPNLFRYVAFDDPAFSQNLRPFEHRYARLLFKVDPHNPVVMVASRALTTEHQHVREALEGVIENEGEGVILRAPKSIYEHGRSTSLVKLKATQKEAEALVVAFKSSHTYQLRLPSGVTFEQEIRNLVPRVGEVVTVEFESMSRREIPEEIRVIRIRKDLTWGAVLHDYYNNPQKNVLNEQSYRVGGGFAAKSHRHWTAQQGKNMRNFFEDFARSRNLDPLNPEDWYSVSRAAILEEKAADSILHHFKRNHARALVALFPEIGLEEKKFAVMPVAYWASVDNRKEFFNQFARKEGFDPLVPNNWYSVLKEHLLSVPGARAVLQYYDQNMGKALIHLFPEVSFNRAKLLPMGNRVDVRTKRNYLNKFAERHGHDPLVAETWYSIPKDVVLSAKGIDAIIAPHTSFVDALMYTYPNIGLQRDKLAAMFHWNSPKTRRKFFVRFARDHWFDPLVPTNWYSVQKEDILKSKGARSMLWHYKGDYVEALTSLFPETCLDKHKFNGVQAPAYLVGMNALKIDRPDIFVHSVYASDSWWAQESYSSGIRVMWNSTTRKLNLQTGAELVIPPSIKRRLPPFSSDGEIWYGRGTNLKSRDLVPTDQHSFNWTFARYLVVDNPSLQKTEFEERFTRLLSGIDATHPFLICAASILFPQNKLNELYKKLAAAIGSGILLRKARSLYEPGSSNALVELMELQQLEALVLSTPQTDKFFDLSMSNQETISAPTSPHVTLELQSGDVVVVHFSKFSSQGLPVNPEIFQRCDYVTWDTVIFSASQKVESQRMKEKMEKFAYQHGFDALITENWYLAQKTSIFKEVPEVLEHFRNNLPDALSHIYPNSFFDPSAHAFQGQKWKEIAAGRQLFISFAKRHHFNPLIPDEWYSVSKDVVLGDKQLTLLIKNFNKDYITALLNCLPEIGLERRGFHFTPRNYWTHATNKKKLFMEYADSKGFDPLIPANWEQHKRQIRVYSHANSVLKHYNGKLGSALAHLFPEGNWHEGIVAKLNNV